MIFKYLRQQKIVQRGNQYRNQYQCQETGGRGSEIRFMSETLDSALFQVSTIKSGHSNNKSVYQSTPQEKIKRKTWIEKIQRLIEAVSKIRKYDCSIVLYPCGNNIGCKRMPYRRTGRSAPFHTEEQILGEAMGTKDFKVVLLELQISHAAFYIRIDKARYKEVAESVVFEAFRQLQRFLIQQCSREIKPISKSQLYSLSDHLINSGDCLPSQEAVTLKAFIRIAYGCKVITMSQYYAARLYAVLMRILIININEQIINDEVLESYIPPIIGVLDSKKTQNKSQTQRLAMVWAPDSLYERTLVGMMKKQQQHRNIVGVRNALKEKFPELKEILTVESVRNMLFRGLRVVMRKFRFLVQNHKDRLPPLTNLDNGRAKHIVRSIDTVPIKVLLLSVYDMSEYKPDLLLLKKIIQKINTFLMIKQNKEELSQYEPNDLSQMSSIF